MTFDTGSVTRLTPAMRREQTRQLLLDAAAAVFAARGYHDASLAEIADTAGYTTGAIYSNFGSKEDLFLAVVEQRRAAMFEQFFAAARDAKPETVIEAIADVYRRLTPTAAQWALWQEFTLYALRNPAVRDKLSAELDETISTLATLLDRRFPSPTGSPLAPRELARLYMAIFDGISQQRALQPDSIPDDLFAKLASFVGHATH